MSNFVQLQAEHPLSLQSQEMTDRIRIQKVEVLSDNWYILKKTTFDFLRSDGSWQRQSRETYDRGNGATILLYISQGSLATDGRPVPSPNPRSACGRPRPLEPKAMRAHLCLNTATP